MAVSIINSNEILLNSVRYPLIGGIRPELTSLWPDKMVTGDYSKATDINKDSWVISDQRGGIGIEEMNEQADFNRCWWSTCNIDFKGHIILPPLATAASMPTHTASGWNQGLNWSDADSEWSSEDNAIDGDTATKATAAQKAGMTGYIEIRIPAISCSKVRYYWSEAVNNGVIDLELGVYYDDAWHVLVSDDSAGEGALAEAAIGATKTVTKARFKMNNNNSGASYLHVLEFYGESATYQGSYLKQVSMGGDEYLAWGNCICRLDIEAGASFVVLDTFPVDITDIFTDGSTLYVYLGDDDPYWYGTPSTSSATLNEASDASETGVDVSNGTQFTIYDQITIDSEDMLVTFISTNTLTVTRGYGSTAATHATGAAITTLRFIPTADDPHDKGATFGAYWDEKVYKIDSAGSMHSLADPATTTPVETDKGDLPVADNELQRLFTYYNIDGDDVLYASTKVGIFVHDEANAKWLRSQLMMPTHTNSGKGVCVWRDGAFISAGLDVLKYIPDVPAQIRSIGLDKDAGMPVEYAGEITWMEAGYNEMYAAVDSSQVSGTGYSAIMAYDGNGWRTKWVDGAADQAITSMHVSSVYAYRLWFNAATTIYSIPLHRNLRNPLKISTDTHALGCIHITPWFDAGWLGGKLALSHELYASGDISVNDTIVVKYRTDHTNTDRDTGWTHATPTLSTPGLNTYTFGSGVGTAFKAIQFRYNIGRKASDTDETPDILYAILYYKKVLPKKWGYRFVVDCSREWAGSSPEVLLDALVTAAEVGTLIQLNYEDTVKYVEIRSVTGEHLTGEGHKGQYTVFCTEL